MMWFYPDLTLSHLKSLCRLLWIFETRIAINIITDQHQQDDCEEDITMFDVIKIIVQQL